MQRPIFLSYRRDDSEGEAGRLYDDLARTYGDDCVFMDVSAINPGVDFRGVIEENVASCGVLLAMIGPHWATITDASGARRLDHPDDFVRLEIAAALRRKVAVIPVLVHEAKMPRPEELPDELKDLAYRNSVEITHTRWSSDVSLLVTALAPYAASARNGSSEPVHATLPVQLPSPRGAEPQAPPPVKKPVSSIVPLIASLAALVLAAVVAFAVFHHRTRTAKLPPTPQPSALNSIIPAAAAVPSTPVTAPPMVASTGPRPYQGADSPASIAGNWIDHSPEGKIGVERLSIAVNGTAVTMHAWSGCCDWGTQPATLQGNTATAVWPVNNPSGKLSRTVTLAVTPHKKKLDVHVSNVWVHRPPNQLDLKFVAAP